MAEVSYVDNRKRGRLLAFSIFMAVMLFVLRGWSLIDIETNVGLLTLGVGYFLIGYLGQIVLFKFNVTQNSLLTVLPQNSLFLTTEALFVMVFFNNDFERAIEIFLLVGLLVLLVMSTYSSLLMSNVFNVATFKNIPLVQVALTASYIVTVMTVYFVSFAVLSAGLHPIIIFFALLSTFIIIFIFHYIHMEMTLKEVINTSITTSFIATIAFMSVFFMGQGYELSALVPASIVYSIVGMEMLIKKAPNKGSYIFRYALVVIFAFIINVLFNK